MEGVRTKQTFGTVSWVTLNIYFYLQFSISTVQLWRRTSQCEIFTKAEMS